MAVTRLFRFMRGLVPGGRRPNGRGAEGLPTGDAAAERQVSWPVSVLMGMGAANSGLQGAPASAPMPHPAVGPVTNPQGPASRQHAPSLPPTALMSGGLAPPSESGPRAVPFPISALTALLDSEPSARARLGHLALLESAWLASRDNPFSLLPLRTLDVALQQIEAAARLSPGLDLLRIQLDRHRQERRSRIEAVLAGGDAAADQRLVLREGVIGASTWTDTEFMETQPFERAAAA